MKTIIDYLIQNKIYEEEIAGHKIELRLSKKCVVMTVDGDRYLIKRFNEDVSPDTEIKYILEENYNTEIRFCEVCGKPFDAGFIAGDGDWYCCEECFEPTMDKNYGKGKWRGTDEEGEYGGFYEFLGHNGEWQDTGIYWTEWN